MHPEINNQTAFATSLLFLGGGNEAPLFAVALMQAVYHIGEGGELVLLPKQPEIVLGGQWLGDPASSSCVLEPVVAFAKSSTDVVLLGSALAPNGQAVTRMPVGLRVGRLQKAAIVIGDRALERGIGGLAVTPPRPFVRMPLTYERAFGGWDRRDADENRHVCEQRNPVGVGFRDLRLGPCEEPRLPNIEDPNQAYTGPGSTPVPCGFGFIGPHWQGRAQFAGTYDKAWQQHRSPRLPVDFDVRFFNAASPGLVTEMPLRGDEPVAVVGLSADGPCQFDLPAAQPLVCEFERHRGSTTPSQAMLDTVIIDMDARRLTLQWRARHALTAGPHGLAAVDIRTGP